MAQEQWNEIEVEVKAPDAIKPVEAETSKTEQEVEPVREQAQAADLKIKGDEEADGEESQALDGIKTDGAQKRIRKLVRQKREIAKQFQDKLADETAKREALEARLKALEEGQTRAQETQAVNYERQLQEREATANKAWQDAFDAGDKEGMLRAEDARVDAKLEKRRLEDWKRQRAAGVKQEAKAPQAPDSQDRQTDDGGGKGPDINPKAKEWIGKQAWWDKDRIMTAATIAIAGELESEGFDPGDDEYYSEVERRLRSELPHKFAGSEAKRPTQVVAGQSRSPAPNKVRLTGEDQRLARLMGLSLEDYARSKQEADNAKGGYVAIDTTRRK